MKGLQNKMQGSTLNIWDDGVAVRLETSGVSEKKNVT